MLITHTKLSNAWGGKWKRKPYDKHLNYLISVHKSTHTRTSFKYILLQWAIKILCKFWLNRAKRNQGLQIRRSASKKGYIEIFRMPSTFANFFVHPWKASLWRGVINEGSGSRACVCTEAKRMLLWNPHNCSPSQQFSSPSQFDQHEPSWLNFIIFFSFQWKSSMKMNFPSSYSPVIKSQLLSPFWGPPLSDKAIKRSLKWINHESFSSEHDASSFLYRMLCAKISTKPKLSRAESHHQISSTSCMMFPTVSYFYWPHQMKLLGRFFFHLLHLKSHNARWQKGFFFHFLVRGSIDKHEKANPWWLLGESWLTSVRVVRMFDAKVK